MFVRNCWYVAAWSHEISAERWLARTITGIPLLLWRSEDGAVVAFEDRCCHRGAPLSVGRREGDSVRCMYHGLRFDRTGRCVEIPSQDFIPPQARVNVFPSVERCGWIWIWMGRAELADPALIPDTQVLTDPEWRGTPGYLHYDANYLLIADNLLDFSHLSYVHEKTLGGSPKYAAARPKIERLERGVRIERWVIDDTPAPFLSAIKAWPGNVDRWNIYRFLAPGILLMDSGSAPTGTGAPQGKRVDAAEFVSCQAITPQSETSTHYFFQQSHRATLQGPNITAELSKVLLAGFEEDRHMILSQQRSLAQAEGFQMLGLRIDSALGIFRSIIEKMLAQERGTLGGSPHSPPVVTYPPDA